MKTSIQWKIVGVYLCVVMIIMITSGSFIIYSIEANQYEKLKTELNDSVENIERILGPEMSEILGEDLDEVASRLRMIISLNEQEIYILDENGRVQIGTSNRYNVKQYVNDPEVLSEAIITKQAVASQWVHFLGNQYTGEMTISYVKPILNRTNDIIAMIYVTTDASEVYDNVKDVMTTISIATVIAICMAVVFSSAFSRMITVPIKQLTSSAKLLAGGSFNRIPIYSLDEIGQLTQSFNYMATELSRTMTDIASEKSKLEKILENMADGVMAFNRQGVLIHANSVCYEMLGTTNMDHRFDFIFPKFGVDISFDRVLASEEAPEDRLMIANEEKYFQLHFAPYMNVMGESEGLVVVMQDVTTQQKLDGMRKEFVANVSHELRTPLTTVKSYTETLLDGAIDNREIAMSFLRVMEKETDRMTDLVKDLLELSRIDNKQMQLEMHLFSLKKLVQETIEAQHIQAEQKGHKLRLECRQDDYRMRGDSARIRQVLHNILSNAIKYSNDPGCIVLKLFKNKEEIILQVQDTGIGVAPKDLKRIFERFYRVDKARSRESGGTGLGLAIAKEMVELHGGTIQMSSKIGKGTTVTVRFPMNRET